MDVSNLVLQLQSKIDSNTINQLTISKAIEQLQLGAVVVVDSYSQLPSASTSTGELFYVLGDGLYWSTGQYWFPIIKNTSDVIWSWGCNAIGRLGDNSTTNRSSPVSVVGGFTDWCRIAAGEQHSLGIITNGTAWAWGGNSDGRLGDGTTVSKSSPVSVVGGFTDWCHVEGGSAHSLGIRTNGTAWAWGSSYCGRLGDNTTTNKSSPVSIAGGFTDWCQVSTGTCHSLGVRTNGTAWAWGANGNGQIGDGSKVATNRSSPVSVAGGFTDWCHVSAGNNFSLGLRTNGTLWAWGGNNSGRLGDNTTVDKSSPVSVVGGFTDWYQVAAGSNHSLGLRTNGTLWAWGYGGAGTLGDNTTVSKSSPVSVVGGFTDWCQIAGGSSHSLGLRTNGTIWTWGSGVNGRLGDNSTTNKSSPVSVAGGFTDWCQIAGGNSHNLAIRKTSL